MGRSFGAGEVEMKWTKEKPTKEGWYAIYHWNLIYSVAYIRVFLMPFIPESEEDKALCAVHGLIVDGKEWDRLFESGDLSKSVSPNPMKEEVWWMGPLPEITPPEEEE
jgi:hypothetical protein